jgi:hypothetical protein
MLKIKMMNYKTKRVIFMLLVLAISCNAVAQKDYNENKSFFKKENLFTGGTLTANFGQGIFTMGLGPYFGYSLNKYVDVAASLNYNYVSQRD